MIQISEEWTFFKNQIKIHHFQSKYFHRGIKHCIPSPSANLCIQQEENFRV